MILDNIGQYYNCNFGVKIGPVLANVAVLPGILVKLALIIDDKSCATRLFETCERNRRYGEQEQSSE